MMTWCTPIDPVSLGIAERVILLPRTDISIVWYIFLKMFVAVIHISTLGLHLQN